MSGKLSSIKNHQNLMKKPVLLVFTLIIFSGFSKAQSISPSVISTSGAFFSNGSGMLSATIGEMSMVETYNSGTSILTQGFQQAFDFVNSIDHPQVPNENTINIFPNPASGNITIEVLQVSGGEWEVSIFDAIGKLVLKAKTALNSLSNKMEIATQGLTNGMYLVEVKSASIKYFKKVNVIK